MKKTRRISDGFYNLAPRVGLEPTTARLTAACSTIELPRNLKAQQNGLRNSGSPGRTRTYNSAVNSRVLYH